MAGITISAALEGEAVHHMDHAFTAERIARKSSSSTIRREALELAEKCRRAVELAKITAEAVAPLDRALRQRYDDLVVALRAGDLSGARMAAARMAPHMDRVAPESK